MSIFPQLDGPYLHCEDCLQNLADVVPIDFYFAQHIMQQYQKALPNNTQDTHSTADKQHTVLLFHMLLALSFYQRQGSVCLALNQIADHTLFGDGDNLSGYVFPNIDILDSSAREMSKVLCEGHAEPFFLVYQEHYLYSKRFYYYEQYFCEFIQTRVHQQIDPAKSQALAHHYLNGLKHHNRDMSSLLMSLFHRPFVDTNGPDFQQVAVLNTLFNTFSIITGGAGTGKTYTLARLVIMQCMLLDISLAEIELVAPTGKAANRLVESLTKELRTLSQESLLDNLDIDHLHSKTVHRLLKIDPSTGQGAFNENRLLPAKIVIIDESSMIDISLMHKLISALSATTHLILVGDANQLPSVESGSLLADLVNHPKSGMSAQRQTHIAHLVPEILLCDDISTSEKSGAFVTRLIASKRSTAGIDKFAGAILDANVEGVFACEHYDDVTLHHDDVFADMKATKQFLESYVVPKFLRITHAKNVTIAFELLQDYALLSPFKKGSAGIEGLNQKIESLLIKQGAILSDHRFYKGKPLMVLQNDYQQGLFNGDVGIVWPDESGTLKAYFKSPSLGLISVPIYSLPATQATYAMTIHKTQGSEYKHVDLLLPAYKLEFLTRELLYTGVTRAREQVRVFAAKSVMTNTILNTVKRVSGIEHSLNI